MYFLENQNELINEMNIFMKFFRYDKLIFEFGELEVDYEEIISKFENDKVNRIITIGDIKYLINYEEKNEYRILVGMKISEYLNNLNNKIELMDIEIAKITDSIYDEIFITNKKGKVIYTNKACERLYNKSKEDFIGINVAELEKNLVFSPSVTSKVLKSGKKESVMQETITG